MQLKICRTENNHIYPKYWMFNLSCVNPGKESYVQSQNVSPDELTNDEILWWNRFFFQKTLIYVDALFSTQQTKNFIWSVLLTSESNLPIMHIKESAFSQRESM